MPRPHKSGDSARPPRKQNLTELAVSRTRPEPKPFNIWDQKAPGLVLRVQPSGHRAFKFVYANRDGSEWYHIGQVGLSEARRIAAKLRLAVAEGRDPVAERKAQRASGTFRELADLYLEQHAKKRNKSWPQARALVERFLLPRWSKLDAKSITRADVRQLVGKIDKPVLANAVLAAASAIFTWGTKQDLLAVNPCRGIEANATQSRERVLSDAEVPLFWEALAETDLVRCYALRSLLLTGQRPGEIRHMRLEHISDGWWTMPGKPDPNLGWPGTKNGESHWVWLVEPVREMIAELVDDATTGFVFAGARGKPVAKLDGATKAACAKLGINSKVTPHDLRRTHGSTITKLGFGRDAMNRIQNHREGGIADVYDRHEYAAENRKIMETVSAHLLSKPNVNVVKMSRVALAD
jgi:integrase